MSDQVLVTYASKYGSTAAIAERIGAVLREQGFLVTVQTVDEVKDAVAYQAIVLGSAVYVGRWLKKASKFLKKNSKTLAERPVWIFSSGPTGEGDPVELLNGWKYPEKIQPFIDQIQPHDIAVFHGDLDVEKVSFIERTMVTKVGAELGDFRDWHAIDAWALSIAEALSQEKVAAV